MNKRIKKKIEKRGGFHKYKSFRDYKSWREFASNYINRNRRRYSPALVMRAMAGFASMHGLHPCCFHVESARSIDQDNT